MTIIPGEQNAELRKKIKEYSEALKVEAHKLGNHGLSETENRVTRQPGYSRAMGRGAQQTG